MPAQPSIRCRFFFRPQEQAPADRVVVGCVVKVDGAPAPYQNNRYLVHRVDDERGLAYLGIGIGASGTFDAQDHRLARIEDLIVQRGPGGRRAEASADSGVYDLTPPHDAPENVRRAYEVLVDWLRGPEAAGGAA